MVTYERQNAVIKSTFLGREDHGLFTFRLVLDYGGTMQSAGDICLGNAKGFHPKSCDLLDAILKVVGVDRWEALTGKPVVAIREEGWNGKVAGIGPLLGGKDLMFAEFFQ